MTEARRKAILLLSTAIDVLRNPAGEHAETLAMFPTDHPAALASVGLSIACITHDVETDTLSEALDHAPPRCPS